MLTTDFLIIHAFAPDHTHEQGESHAWLTRVGCGVDSVLWKAVRMVQEGDIGGGGVGSPRGRSQGKSEQFSLEAGFLCGLRSEKLKVLSGEFRPTLPGPFCHK